MGWVNRGGPRRLGMERVESKEMASRHSRTTYTLSCGSMIGAMMHNSYTHSLSYPRRRIHQVYHKQRERRRRSGVDGDARNSHMENARHAPMIYQEQEHGTRHAMPRRKEKPFLTSHADALTRTPQMFPIHLPLPPLPVAGPPLGL